VAGTAREPQYRKISDWLRDRIVQGALPPGHPLPSEEQLARQFGVSRPTVRQGVAELRHAGLVEVLVGRGSFVRARPSRPPFTRRRGHREESPGEGDGSGNDAGAVIVWVPVGDGPCLTRAEASVTVADLLRVPPREPLFVWEVLESTQGDRFRQTHRTLIPFQLLACAPAAPGSDTETGGDEVPDPGEVLAWLESQGYGLTWNEHVTARLPLPDEATALRTPDGTPLIQITRITLDRATARPLILEEIAAPAADQELQYTYGP
jgi:GntR family transcriptional regulator